MNDEIKQYAYVPDYSDRKTMPRRRVVARKRKERYTVPIREGQRVVYKGEMEVAEDMVKRRNDVNQFRLWHGGQGSIRQKELTGAFNGQPLSRFAERPVRGQVQQRAIWDVRYRKKEVRQDPTHVNYRIESRGANLRSRAASIKRAKAQQKVIEQKRRQGLNMETQARQNYEGYGTRERLSYLNGLRNQLAKVKPQFKPPAPAKTGTYA